MKTTITRFAKFARTPRVQQMLGMVDVAAARVDPDVDGPGSRLDVPQMENRFPSFSFGGGRTYFCREVATVRGGMLESWAAARRGL
jgi:hypothetical protein